MTAAKPFTAEEIAALYREHMTEFELRLLASYDQLTEQNRELAETVAVLDRVRHKLADALAMAIGEIAGRMP